MRLITGVLVATMALAVLSGEAMAQKKISPDVMAMLRRFFEQHLKGAKGKHSFPLPPGFTFPVEDKETPTTTVATPAPTPRKIQEKMGVQLKKPRDDYCEVQTHEAFQEFCTTMEDGFYMDPWDPYCGFIQCQSQNASRHCCEKGSWTGYKASISGRQSLCRHPIKILDAEVCPVPTSNDKMCDKAEWVVTYNKMQF